MRNFCLLVAYVTAILMAGCQSPGSRTTATCKPCGLGKVNESYRIGRSHCIPIDESISQVVEEVETEQVEELETQELSLQECHAMAVEHLCSPESDLEHNESTVNCEARNHDDFPLTSANANVAVSVKGDISPYMHYHYRQVLSERIYQVEEAFWSLHRAQELCELHSDNASTLKPAQRSLGKLLGLSSRSSDMLVVSATPVEAPIHSNVWDEVWMSVNKRAETLEARDNETLMYHFDDGENELVTERAELTEETIEEVKQKVTREVTESYHNVLKSQQELKDAETAESRVHAVANYNVALAELQWRRGTLLERRGIQYEIGYACGYMWNCSDSGPCNSNAYYPREGDVLLFTSKHPCYWDIAYRLGRSGQPFHSAVVVRRSDGSLGLAQAGGDDDTIITLQSVKYYLEEMSLWRSNSGIWIRRRKCPLTPRQSAALTTFAEERIGLPFTSTWTVLLWWLPGQPIPETKNDQETWFCSEFVGQALKYAGLIPQSVQAQLLTPRGLMFDKDVDLSRCWGPPIPWTATERFTGELPRASPDYCPKDRARLLPSICRMTDLLTR